MNTFFLSPIREWLDSIEIPNPKVARLLCRCIPAQCPFAREVKFFDRTLLNVPPLCKLNPLYDQLMMIRFRALTYLCDQCHQDVSSYC